MSFLKTIALILLSFLLATSITLLAIVNATTSNFLNEKFYAQELEKLNAFEQIQTAAAQQITQSLPQELLAIVPESTINEKVKAIISKEWLKTQTTQALKDFFKFLNSETDSFSLKVNLADLKPKLRQEIESIIQEKLSSPQIPEALKSLASQQAVEQAMLLVPDTYSFGEFKSNSQELNTARQAVSLIKTASTLLVITSILLAILILAVCYKELGRGLKTIGKVALSSGVSILVAVFILSEFGKKMIENIIAQNAIAINSINPLIKQLTSDIIDAFNSTLIWEGIVILAIGAVLFAAGFLLARKKQVKEKTKAKPTTS